MQSSRSKSGFILKDGALSNIEQRPAPPANRSRAKRVNYDHTQWTRRATMGDAMGKTSFTSFNHLDRRPDQPSPSAPLYTHHIYTSHPQISTLKPINPPSAHALASASPTLPSARSYTLYHFLRKASPRMASGPAGSGMSMPMKALMQLPWTSRM